MRFLAFVGVSALLMGQSPAPTPAAPKPQVAKPSAAKPAAAKPKPATAKPASATPAAKPAAPKGSPDDPIVFRVGDEAMTRSQFDAFLAALPDNVRTQINAPGGKRQLAERFAEMKALAQEARRTRIDQKPDVQMQLALQVDQVLAGSMYQSLVEKAKPSEAETRKYYDAHLKEYDQAKARHILIRFQGSRVPLKEGQKDLTDEEALAKTKDLRQQIIGGKDFAAVAKAESDDTGSGANGGDLGSFGRGRMVPQFEEAVFSSEKGKISEPIKTPFGYHLIEVQERNTRPYEEVRAEIEKKSVPDEARKSVEAIKANSRIMLDEAYFPPAPPQPPPAVGPNPGAPPNPGAAPKPVPLPKQ